MRRTGRAVRPADPALRCGRPGRTQALYRVSDTGARVPNSQVAHIHARREYGPRWDPAMTEEENRGYGNLTLLCLDHASEIDATPDLYPAEVLREWKRLQVATQEQAARALPPLSGAEADEVIRLSAVRTSYRNHPAPSGGRTPVALPLTGSRHGQPCASHSVLARAIASALEILDRVTQPIIPEPGTEAGS